MFSATATACLWFENSLWVLRIFRETMARHLLFALAADLCFLLLLPPPLLFFVLLPPPLFFFLLLLPLFFLPRRSRRLSNRRKLRRRDEPEEDVVNFVRAILRSLVDLCACQNFCKLMQNYFIPSHTRLNLP